MKQRTIAKKIQISGKALQNGTDVSMQCFPAPVDTGIVFRKREGDNENTFQMGDVLGQGQNGRRTTVGTGAFMVQTVEHFLAALWGLRISNIIIEIKGIELPAKDGSAKGFFNEIKAAGIKEQEYEAGLIIIDEPIRIEDGEASLEVLPSEVFKISYEIDYDCPAIGKEIFELELDERSFEDDIAPARTFCLKKEAEALLAAGLGKGATLENTLVMGDNGPVGTELRFPNEPLRHKIADLIGDLYVLGVPIRGNVIAKRSGHKLNAMMVKAIYDRYVDK